jgi:cyanate lyase
VRFWLCLSTEKDKLNKKVIETAVNKGLVCREISDKSGRKEPFISTGK